MREIILLAIEDENIQNTLGPILESEGFSVLVETDSRWAARIFEKRNVRFVILGGEKGGLELAGKIRKTIKGRDTPILMIGETSRKPSILQAARRAYDLVDMLQTPVRPERVLKILRSTLGGEYPSSRDVQEDRAALAPGRPGKFAGPDSERERTEVERNSGLFRTAARKGSLAAEPFPALLGRLYREKVSGAMLLQRRRSKKLVYFQDGCPTVIKSNRLEECLGRLLVRSKMITEDECRASLQKMKTSGRQQGTVLVGMGCISPSSLKRALELQLQMKLFGPFDWEEGAYRFDPGGEPPPATVSLDITPATAIFRGIKRKLELPRLEKLLAEDLAMVPVPNPDPLLRFQTLSLEEDERKQLERVQGGKTLRDLLDEHPKERLSLCRLLYALKCTGMFTFEQRTVEPPDLGLDDQPTTTDETAPAAQGRELSQVRQMLALDLQCKQQQEYFELLDVPRDATGTQIASAFRALVRRYHPDRGTNVGSTQVRRLNLEVFNLVCEAHKVLSKDHTREAYLKEIDASGDEPSPPPEPAAASTKPSPGPSTETVRGAALPGLADNALTAERWFSVGEQAMGKRDYQTARSAFEKAVDLCPDEGEFRAEMALAMFRSDPDNTTVVRLARDELNQSISTSPILDKAHLYLGYIYRRMGQHELGVHEFEQALLCNPRCTEAVRELRLLRMRQKPAKKGLGRLLGRFKR